MPRPVAAASPFSKSRHHARHRMITCKKTYTDIPWAHRQHRHDGHCAFIHGHNWSITIIFGCHATDENGFVVDFGKLKFLEEWIDTHLDHAIMSFVKTCGFEIDHGEGQVDPGDLGLKTRPKPFDLGADLKQQICNSGIVSARGKAAANVDLCSAHLGA